MNEFYSILKINEISDNSYYLNDLGDQIPLITVGKRKSDYWGTPGTESKTFYRKTTPEDYDSSFVHKIITTKPPYEIPNLLDFHLNYYLQTKNGSLTRFIKHIKYVIAPLISKIKDKEVYLELINEWLNGKSANRQTITTSQINIINTGEINAPTQFQQNAQDSNQNLNIEHSQEIIEKLFEALRKDIASLNLNPSTTAEFETEIEYASKELKKGKDIKAQLKNIGQLIKDIGINVFANLIASPIYEIIKPYLGL